MKQVPLMNCTRRKCVSMVEAGLHRYVIGCVTPKRLVVLEFTVRVLCSQESYEILNELFNFVSETMK